jgi:hypothetical protein
VEEYRVNKIHGRLSSYMEDLQRLASGASDTFVFEELKLWAESIA